MADPKGPEGRFTTGSTMRHVTVMTLTGSLGLTFMFLVDFVTLLYVSMLGDEGLTSAVGYAWTIQFFTISVGIGFAIAATAAVSRSLGARERDVARRQASSSLVITTVVLGFTAAAVMVFREPLLAALGAEGRTLEVASRFLLITLSSLPLMAFGMVGSSILRAEGDARRAMMVTLSAGLVAAILDPFLIFERFFGIPGLGLGVDGAAAVLVISRVMTAGVAIWYVVRIHDLAARPTVDTVLGDLRPILRIAVPASLTQLSTPFGNGLLTAAIAQYGDSAVAGWAVVSRMTVLAFGGIFALSGAIGGIVGQNYGARKFERVRLAYRDSLLFCAIYVSITWMLLWAASDAIAAGFSLSEQGAEVVRVFGAIGAGAFVFAGALFVANAAFNNLGRPIWSTGFNWSRDAVAVPLLIWLMAYAGASAPGVIYAQAIASVLVGAAAAVWGWIYVRRLETAASPSPSDEGPRWGGAPPLTSGRAAASAPIAEASGTQRRPPR